MSQPATKCEAEKKYNFVYIIICAFSPDLFRPFFVQIRPYRYQKKNLNGAVSVFLLINNNGGTNTLNPVFHQMAKDFRQWHKYV